MRITVEYIDGRVDVYENVDETYQTPVIIQFKIGTTTVQIERKLIRVLTVENGVQV